MMSGYKKETKMNSKKKIARWVGFLYFLLALVGPFSLMYVPTTLIVPGNGAATASNIISSVGLYRLGLVGEATIFLIEIGIIALLYVLLKSVNETISLAAALSRLAMAVIQGINVMSGLAVLVLLGSAGYAATFEPAQLNGLVLFLLDLRHSGVLVWQLFFGLHLLLLGYLFLKSAYIPRLLAVGVVIASLGYFSNSLGNILFPGNEALLETVVTAMAAIPEVALTLWLLIRGVDDSRQKASASLSPTTAH